LYSVQSHRRALKISFWVARLFCIIDAVAVLWADLGDQVNSFITNGSSVFFVTQQQQ
jgi:hypothetical protein